MIIMHKRDRATARIVSIAVALLLVAAAATARADAKVPSAPDDYFAIAKQYREKAETYKKEAKEHRDMAEAAKKSPANAHEAHGQKDPSVGKMVKHCNAIATKADALAVANEKAADFYELRGKEIKGK